MVMQAHAAFSFRWRSPGPLHLLASALLALLLSGCGTGYLLQAARGQWQVQHGRQPLARVIAAPGTDPVLRSRLQEVGAARDFASRELGLPNNASYRTYRALGRPYVVWNVVAAPEFSLQPKRWCFPVVGCLSYRGYFRQRSAEAYAAQLRHQGFDVMVGGVSAYSTLGHFPDPILDTMMRYGELELISTLFHELAHQLVYARGDTEFNESFATAVEREGLRRWLAAQGRGAELEAYLARERDADALRAPLLRVRQQLAVLYAGSLPVPEKRARKRSLLASAGEELQQYEKAHGLRSGYDQWISEGLNNAHLALLTTYHDCVPAFDRLLAEQGGDLHALYARAQGLARGPAAARHSFCTAG